MISQEEDGINLDGSHTEKASKIDRRGKLTVGYTAMSSHPRRFDSLNATMGIRVPIIPVELSLGPKAAGLSE